MIHLLLIAKSDCEAKMFFLRSYSLDYSEFFCLLYISLVCYGYSILGHSCSFCLHKLLPILRLLSYADKKPIRVREGEGIAMFTQLVSKVFIRWLKNFNL